MISPYGLILLLRVITLKPNYLLTLFERRYKMNNIINTTYTKILKETKSILEKYPQKTDIENNRITIKQGHLPYIKAEIVNYISSLNDTNYNPSLLIDTKQIGNNAHHTLKFCSTIDNETRLYVEYPNILIENTKKQINVIKHAKTSIYDLLSWHNYTDLENLFNAMVEHQRSLFDYYKTAIVLSHDPFAKKSEIEYNNLSSLEKKTLPTWIHCCIYPRTNV